MSGVRKEVSVDLDEDAAASAAPAVVDEDAPVAAGSAVPAGVVDEDVDPLDKVPDRAVRNADGSITLPLLYPQELQIRRLGKIRTDKYDSLTFHRLNGADQRAIAAASDETQAVVAFGRSTRMSQAIMNALFDKMDGADIAAGGQVLNSFFATGRTTGR